MAHPLVARLVRGDFTLAGQAAAAGPSAAQVAQQDALVDTPHARSAAATPRSFNLTLCALATGEDRFLPEWLLYHRLLGVERFALYDAVGAAGATEVEAVAEQIAAEGKGALGSTAGQIQASRPGQGLAGVDASGHLYPERLGGLEAWIEQGVVVLHHMKFPGEPFILQFPLAQQA